MPEPFQLTGYPWASQQGASKGLIVQLMNQLYTMPDFQTFLQQRVAPMRDILAQQAVGARSSLVNQLASRGMTRTGALPAGLGAIEQGKMQALAQLMPGMMDEYYRQRMGLYQAVMPLLGMTQQQEQGMDWTSFFSTLGKLGLGVGGMILGGPAGAAGAMSASGMYGGG